MLKDAKISKGGGGCKVQGAGAGRLANQRGVRSSGKPKAICSSNPRSATLKATISTFGYRLVGLPYRFKTKSGTKCQNEGGARAEDN